MRIVRANEASVDESPSTMFAGGKVSRYGLVGRELSDTVWVSLVRFEPGVRTRLHTHDFLQVLYVTEGRGILATADQEHEVTPGTLIIVPPGEPHWHGATRHGPFAHLGTGSHGETAICEG